MQHFVKVKRCHQYLFIIYLSPVPAKSISFCRQTPSVSQSQYPNLISRQRHLWFKRCMRWLKSSDAPATKHSQSLVMSSWLPAVHTCTGTQSLDCIQKSVSLTLSADAVDGPHDSDYFSQCHILLFFGAVLLWHSDPHEFFNNIR